MGGLAVTLAAAALAAAAPDATKRQRPIVSLSASPTTITASPRTLHAITLTKFGASRVRVHAGTSGLAVDVRGRPRLVHRPAAGRNAARWLRIRPRELTVSAGGSRVVHVSVRAPRGAQPGDHHAAVVFTTRPLERGRVGVRVRLAVRLSVRAPGAVRRRLTARSLRVRRVGHARRLEVLLANRGNVTERLARRVRISLGTQRRTVVPVRTRRELLPGHSGVVVAVYRGAHRGLVSARVEIRGAGTRTFRIRL
jgi:hypothetical protein